MRALQLPTSPDPLRVLCIGAHSDDIEIGCAGTLLGLVARGQRLQLDWIVLSAVGERAAEAKCSAEQLFGSSVDLRLRLAAFRDAHFPAQFSALKEFMADARDETDPDLIFTHCIEDRHQDHRLVGELTWQAWRNHLILEYEVPKYEGDLPRPNLFVPVTQSIAQAKVDHVVEHFASQRPKGWFDRDTFMGLMRLRGVECRASEGLAEGFVARKMVL